MGIYPGSIFLIVLLLSICTALILVLAILSHSQTSAVPILSTLSFHCILQYRKNNLPETQLDHAMHSMRISWWPIMTHNFSLQLQNLRRLCFWSELTLQHPLPLTPCQPDGLGYSCYRNFLIIVHFNQNILNLDVYLDSILSSNVFSCKRLPKPLYHSSICTAYSRSLSLTLYFFISVIVANINFRKAGVGWIIYFIPKVYRSADHLISILINICGVNECCFFIKQKQSLQMRKEIPNGQ